MDALERVPCRTTPSCGCGATGANISSLSRMAGRCLSLSDDTRPSFAAGAGSYAGSFSAPVPGVAQTRGADSEPARLGLPRGAQPGSVASDSGERFPAVRPGARSHIAGPVAGSRERSHGAREIAKNAWRGGEPVRATAAMSLFAGGGHALSRDRGHAGGNGIDGFGVSQASRHATQEGCL